MTLTIKLDSFQEKALRRLANQRKMKVKDFVIDRLLSAQEEDAERYMEIVSKKAIAHSANEWDERGR